MNGCHYQVLSQTSKGYIGVCNGCHEFNLVFNNLLLTFGQEQLFEFGQWIVQNKHSPEHHFELANGKDWVFRSPVNNLSIAFDHEEIDEIADLLTQAKLMLEINGLLKK